MTQDPTQRMRENACNKCGVVRPLTDFHRRKDSTNGHQKICKLCVSKYRREVYYPANPQKSAIYGRKWIKENPEKYRLKLSRRKRYPIQEKARQAVGNAVYAGKFEKSVCQECGATRTQFHHSNGYDEPNWFTGVWLCIPHHNDVHRELRRQKLEAALQQPDKSEGDVV